MGRLCTEFPPEPGFLFSGCSRFLPQSQDVQLRWNEDIKLSIVINVSVNDWLYGWALWSTCAFTQLRVYPGFLPNVWTWKRAGWKLFMWLLDDRSSESGEKSFDLQSDLQAHHKAPWHDTKGPLEGHCLASLDPRRTTTVIHHSFCVSQLFRFQCSHDKIMWILYMKVYLWAIAHVWYEKPRHHDSISNHGGEIRLVSPNANTCKLKFGFHHLTLYNTTYPNCENVHLNLICSVYILYIFSHVFCRCLQRKDMKVPLKSKNAFMWL